MNINNNLFIYIFMYLSSAGKRRGLPKDLPSVVNSITYMSHSIYNSIKISKQIRGKRKFPALLMIKSPEKNESRRWFLEAAGLRPSILRQLNEALKTPEDGGGGFQLLEYRWPRWSSRGVNFLNHAH